MLSRSRSNAARKSFAFATSATMSRRNVPVNAVSSIAHASSNLVIATRPAGATACALLSTGPGAVRKRSLGDGERGRQAVGIADVEEHALRYVTSHPLRWQIQHEQRLAADELQRIRTLLFHAGENLSCVIAEAHGESHQLFRISDIVDRLDRPQTDVERIDGREVHDRFDGRGCECRHTPAAS